MATTAMAVRTRFMWEDIYQYFLRDCCSGLTRSKRAAYLNLQTEIAFASLAPKLVAAAATVCGSQNRDCFIVYPAPRALEITSTYRHEAAETF